MKSLLQPHSVHVFALQPVGSAFFIAPEVFKRAYTKACDLWSLGVNLFLLLGGTVPFGAKATKATEVYRAIQRDKLVFQSRQWATISGHARELIAGLLEMDPTKRYTIQDALSHPWVNGAYPLIAVMLPMAMLTIGVVQRTSRPTTRSTPQRPSALC